MVTVGIIVVHFGNTLDTIECLESLKITLPKKIKCTIFLVDNDPNHRLSLSQIKRGLSIKRILSQKNTGFAGGFNTGIKEALKNGCEYILLLNNDVVVKPKLIEKQLAYLKKGAADLVSPIITYYDKPNTIWCMDGYLNTLFLFTKHPNMDKKINSVSLDKPIISTFAAACLMVRSNVFKKIGLFDERYFITAEDVEWCLRAKIAGFKLIYMPFPLAMHKVSANTGVRGTNLLTPLSAYYYGRNFFIMLRDHKDIFHLTTGLIGQTCIRLPFYVTNRMASLKAILFYILGYIDGLYYVMTGNLILRRLRT